MYYVYVLENPEGKHYIGSPGSIETRLKRHNQNSVRSTKNKGPWRIIYRQECNSKRDARKLESHLKSYKNFNYIKEVLKINETPSSSLV